MSLIIDLLIIFAAAAAIYLGIMRGFVKSVMSFLSLILAIAAVYFFTAPAAEWLNDKFVDAGITGIVDDALQGIVNAGADNIDLETIIADRPEALTQIADRFGCDLDELAAYYDDKLSELSDSEALDELSDRIASPTANAISTVLAALAIFIAAMLVLKCITLILDMIFRLPVLNKLNSFFGFLFGLVNAAVTVWVISNLAVGIISALESVKPTLFNQTVISGSLLLRFMYEHGLILFK